MAGNKEGAAKAVRVNLERDPDHYSKLGIKGGAKKGAKGYAVLGSEYASESGKKGSTVRWGKRVDSLSRGPVD